MSKPKWDDAPEWAMWLACDRSGVWYWFLHKPVKMPLNYWFLSSADAYRDGCEFTVAFDENGRRNDWCNTLEQRP